MSGRILIAEGQASYRILLRARLHAAGHATHCVDNPSAALSALQLERPDLVLIGAGMGAAGTGLCQRIKTNPLLADIPVVLLLPRPNRAAVLTGLNCGADDVLVADGNDPYLLARLQGLIHFRSGVHRLLEADSTALDGLQEAPSRFDPPLRIGICESHATRGPALCDLLPPALRRQARVLTLPATPGPRSAAPDVVVMSIAPGQCAASLLRLARLRAQPDLQDSLFLVLVEGRDRATAVDVVNLGVEDVMLSPIEAEELAARLYRLGRQKRRIDRLQSSIQQGLKAAVRDSLTGLYNRHYAMPQLRRMLAEDSAPCSMLLLDIDHFKQVNDRFGHMAGDAALRAVAKRLQAGLQRSDLLARIGGEEFLVLLPGRDLRAAMTLAENLCRRVAVLPFDPCSGAPAISLTVSIGVTSHQPGTRAAPSADRFLRQADQALYQAKAGGRNCATLLCPAA